ncbi:phage baseplate assembly protein V [Prolixibacteraceae bacterium]|nr:phage baseplate assembly protein V [Prolixibacteraceae bacterium]
MKENNISLKIDDVEIPSFQQVVLDQKIHEHHILTLILDLEVAEKEGNHTLDKSKSWIGKELSFSVDTFIFRGVVTDIALSHSKGHHGKLEITGTSRTIKLDAMPHMQSWLDKSLEEIVQEVAEKSDVKIQVKPQYTSKIPYETQYLESGYDFLKRLSYQYGEWMYYDGTTLCFGKPENSQEPIEVEYGSDISSIDVRLHTAPFKQKVMSYNAMSDELATGISDGNVDGLNDLGRIALTASNSLYRLEGSSYGHRFMSNKGDVDSYLKKHQAADAARSHTIWATGMKSGLTIGSLIEVKSAKWDMQQFDEQTYGQYLVIGIKHIVRENGYYEYKLEAISASVETLPLPHVTLPQAQMQLAEVIDNKDPDQKGRIRVKMNWQEGEMKTSWIRIVSPDAGMSDVVSSNRGFVFIPEVGDQVLLGFRYNDPNRPFALGSLFHGNSGAGGGDNNKTKSITTRSGCSIVFDDEKGAIMLIDGAGNTVCLDGEKAISFNSLETISMVSGEAAIELNKDGTVNIQGKEVNIVGSDTTTLATSSSSVSTSSDTITVAGQKVEVTGQQTVEIAGQTKVVVSSSVETSIEGAIVKINS